MARPGWYNENSGRDFPFVFSRDTAADASCQAMRARPDIFVDFGCVVGIHADFVEGEHSIWLAKLKLIDNYIEIDFHSDAPGLAEYKLQFTREIWDTDYEIEYAQVVARDYSSLSLVEVSTQPYCVGDSLWEGFLVTKDIEKLHAMFDKTVQIIRPIADVINGTFLPSTGSDLWAMLDDDPWNDSFFVYSQLASASDLFVVGMAPAARPGVGTVKVRYRIQADLSATSFFARLLQGPGGTTIQTWIESTPPTVQTTYEQEVGPAEQALITDYSQLQLLFLINGAPVARPLLAVADAEIEVPASAVQEIDFDDSSCMLVEPGLIQNLAGHYMSTLNVFNADRTRGERVDGCIPWCWPEDAYGVYAYWPVSTCLAGDIRIAEGYNCTIIEDSYSNRLTFNAAVGKGLGEPPGELQYFPTEDYPEYGSYLDGSVGCDEVVRTINGVEGPHTEIIGGQGITVDTIPGQHLIIVKIDMQDLTGCFEQEASTSLSEYTPDPDPCACGEE